MEESKEYSTIVKCSRKLEIALKSDRNIALFLLQQGFITQERYDEVINPKSNLTDAEKASMLVTAIRDRVELNPRNYHKVVDHLHQNIIRYGDIVEILDQQYHQTTAVGNPFQPATTQSVMTTPSPPPVPNASPSIIPFEGMTSMMAEPTLPSVPNAALLEMRSPDESSEGVLVTPSPPPAVPNASPSPRYPCDGTTSNPPPSSGSFSVSTTQSSTDCATPSKDNLGKSATANEKFPYLKSEHLSEEERGMLMGRLIVDSENIRSKFSSLLFRTAESLSNEKVSVRFLKILLKPYKISELDESDDEVSQILLKAFEDTYCSLFSFKIVKDIIDHLGTNDDKERLAKYEASFKDYCKRRLCEVPTEVLNPGGSEEKKRTELYVKTDEIFEVPLEKIYVIQSEISRILEKPIHLKGMKEGCVELIFYLFHELDEIFPLNEKQMNLLKGIGVSRVYDEHKEYFSVSKDSPNEGLEQHVLTLANEFRDISIKMFEAIKKKALDISRFRALHIEYKDQHKEFFRQLMDFPEKDTTIDHIWTRLSGHWDFLNYTLLENLVYEFGDRTLKGDMGDYVKQLKLFRSSTRICDFAKYHSKVNKQIQDQQDFQHLLTESKLSWSKSTLEDLEEVKENLTQQFSLPSFVMNLKDVVQQGSIRITWRLPTLIASGLRKNLENMDISKFYKENGIECIFIDGKEFSAGTKSMLTTPTQLPSGSSPVPSKQSSTDPSGRIQPCGKGVSDDSDSRAESFQLRDLNFKDEFKGITIKILHKIKESLDVSRFRARLDDLHIEYRDQHKEFFRQLMDFPEKDTTIDHIWTRLSGHWDFLNYTLLENLVYEFGDCTLKRDMGDYMKRLKLFRSSTQICDFAKYHSKVDKQISEQDFQDLMTESKLSWSKSTLEDLEKVKENLTQQFTLPSFVMSLKDVRQGSIRVIWRLPTPIASGLRENLKNMDIREFCKENGMERILIDGKECKYSPKEKYSAYLKDLYSKMEGKNLSPFKLAQIEKEEIDIKKADEFTKGTFRGDTDDIMYAKFPMTEADIGHRYYHHKRHKFSQPPRLVLIEGAPGVGKTTFSEQFCHKWSQGQRLKDHTLLILLPLRNNRVKSARSVSDLFLHPHLQQAIAQEVESTQGEGVALLLEGWDELEEEMREKSSIFLDLVCGRALPKATIIVTSRPWASKTIIKSSHIEVDQHIELLTTPKIQYDRVMREDRVKAEDKEKFKDYILFNPSVKAAMHTPVTADIITEVFQWSRDTDSPLPTTMTQLYTSYTCKLLTQHFSSDEAHGQQSQKIRSLEDLPPDAQQQLEALSLVAWEGIVKQQLTFSGCAVKESLGLMQKTGELYSEEDSQVSRHFIHLTLQEFLASYHISRLPTDQQQKIIEQYIRFGHLKVVIKFFFGIVRNGAFASSMIAKHLNHERDTSPFLWMYEINDPEFIREILGPDESVRVHSSYEWSPLDYYSVGYVISNSLCKWELYFYSSSMGDEEMEMWCKGAMNCKEDTGSEQEMHADFSFNTLTVEGLKWFVKLPHHLLQRIVSLKFSDSKLDKKALDLLSQVVPALSKLEVLYLSYNPIREGGAVELMRSLSHYKTPLKKLYLQETSLGEEDIQALCEVLADNHIIELLAIDGPIISIMRLHAQTIRVKTLYVRSPMSVDSCTSLASLLKHRMCQLKELYIYECSINSDGAVQLAAALSENKSVVEVNIFGNKDIGDVGAGAFGDMLRRNTVLQELDLSDCGITSQGCDRLAGGVRANSTLQVLDLSNNRIEEKGVDLMLISLKFNKILKKLVLSKAYKRPADPRVEWTYDPLYAELF